MSYTGQPVPSTTYQSARAKVGDGKSVRVSVPPNSGDIAAGQLCYFDGFLGFAMQSLANNATAAQDLILQIEIAEYETDQVLATDTMSKGAKVYWDAVNKRLTETPTAVFAGVVTVAKDANNVIWFLLTPGIMSDDVADLVGNLTTLTTTDKGSTVAAINEVDEKVGTALGRVAANVVCAEDADATAVRTALRELLAALEAAGLMAAADAGGGE